MSKKKVGDFTYDEVATALKESYKNKGGWTGPKEYHCNIGATCGSPESHLDKGGLEYHKERDRDLLDVLFMVAFQMGYTKGACTSDEYHEVMHEGNARMLKSKDRVIGYLEEELATYRPKPVVDQQSRNEVIEKMLKTLRGNKSDAGEQKEADPKA